jgi:hypothetical protein
MRKTLCISLSAVAILLGAATSRSLAADAKTVTITGEGKCAKCALKESDTCQNVIQTTENGKKVTYYITKNDIANGFHKTVCQTSKQVTAKGTVKDVNGKKELTVTEIKTAE